MWCSLVLKFILAAASAHSIDHLSCSAKSLITLVGAENLRPGRDPPNYRLPGWRPGETRLTLSPAYD